jgi:hypothetical protein
MEEYRELSDEHMVEWLKTMQNPVTQEVIKPKKVNNYLRHLIIIPPILLIMVLVYILLRGGHPITLLEIKLLTAFLILSVVFGLLSIVLLRNSIVSNTKCLIQLRKSISNWEKVSIDFSRELKSASSTINKNADSNTQIADALAAVTSKILDIVTSSIK